MTNVFYDDPYAHQWRDIFGTAHLIFSSIPSLHAASSFVQKDTHITAPLDLREQHEAIGKKTFALSVHCSHESITTVGMDRFVW